MRILFYNNRFKPSFGGTETHLALLSEQLSQKGNTVSILTTKFVNTSGYEKFATNTVIESPVKVFRLFSIRLFGKDALTIPLGILSKLSFINSFDLFHMYTYGYLSTALIALLKWLKLIKIPIIFQPHYAPNNTYGQGLEKFYTMLFGRLIVKASSRIILLTPTFQHYFENLGASHFTIIPPAIKTLALATEEECNAERESLGIPRNSNVMFSISRLTKGKGLDILINGFAAATSLSETHLIIAGQGSEYENLKKLITELGISHRIHLLTQISDQRKSLLYNVSTSFVLISYSAESFGITLVEAMQFGLPILASNIGAIPYVLKDYDNKVVVNPSNANEVIRGIVSVNERNKILNARSMQEYSPVEIAQTHEKLYSDILSDNRTST